MRLKREQSFCGIMQDNKKDIIHKLSSCFFSLLVLFLCINMARADEVWRCAKPSGGICIFAWWLHADGSLETTAGAPAPGKVEQKNGQLISAVGAFHHGNVEKPEWEAKYQKTVVTDTFPPQDIWSLVAYGTRYKIDDAICRPVEMAGSKFRDGCLTYYYYTDIPNRLGYFSTQNNSFGGPIATNSSSTTSGPGSEDDCTPINKIKSPGKCKTDISYSDTRKRKLSLSVFDPPDENELAQLCGRGSEENKKSCEDSELKELCQKSKKENGVSCANVQDNKTKSLCCTLL